MENTKRYLSGALLLGVFTFPVITRAAEQPQTEVRQKGEDALLIIEDSGDDALVIEKGDDLPRKQPDSRVINLEQGGSKGLDASDQVGKVSNQPIVKVDELWAEYGSPVDSGSHTNSQGYLHSRITASWEPGGPWNLQASIRVDGYTQDGSREWDQVRLDYDETFIRYQGDDFRITAGTQKIVWGRIDEFPPTDRLSTHDLSRYILDDLSDRRRASGALRFEQFSGNTKLDLVILPFFREAELPGLESVWFPVNRHSGEILGLVSTPATVALIKSAPLDLKAPDSWGGFGFRYSTTGEGLDYTLSLQRVRQSIPYFNYNAARGVLEARYPRSWVVGGDVGLEAMGAIWRVELAWSSDAPVTREDGSFSTVKSLNWGGGVEFFPGDGDARINFQLTGINHINAPAMIDRKEVYLFGGSFEIPLAQDRWRVKGRFYTGLDTHDLYLNPEIAYTGWESQELYLGGHYFEGAAGTPGGFHRDDSILTAGWRVKF